MFGGGGSGGEVLRVALTAGDWLSIAAGALVSIDVVAFADDDVALSDALLVSLS